MSWQKEVDELQHRRELMRGMGGEERILRHHEQGKLTARERVAAIVDEGSFREFRTLVGESRYEDGELVDFLPKGMVEGMARLEGRKVVIDRLPA